MREEEELLNPVKAMRLEVVFFVLLYVCLLYDVSSTIHTGRVKRISVYELNHDVTEFESNHLV